MADALIVIYGKSFTVRGCLWIRAHPRDAPALGSVAGGVEVSNAIFRKACTTHIG